MILDNPEHNPAPASPKQSEILRTLSERVGFTPDLADRPKRCRAIIFSPDGKKVLGILRKRPGREPYVVFPGGGVEDEDSSAVVAIRRELLEELDLREDDVYLNGRALSFEDEVGGGQFYYLGQAKEEFDSMIIHGPEAERDAATSGSYDPVWVDVGSIEAANFQPEEIAQVIVEYR